MIYTKNISGLKGLTWDNPDERNGMITLFAPYKDKEQ